jgi:RND superfamily putative drug exporter
MLTTRTVESRHSTPFKRLGGFVHRRRKYIIVAWIIALALSVPIIVNEGNVTSLQQGSASGNQLESVQASNLIFTEFAKTVPYSTLLIVVNGKNVSSVSTQKLVHQVTTSLKADTAIRGLTETVDVYSPLYSTITSINRAAYASADGANGTGRLLLGVPALFLGLWEKAYTSTQNVAAANDIAFNTTATALSLANATSYRLYSSHILSLFYSAWVASWSNASLAKITILDRATSTARTADYQYLSTETVSSRSFGYAVLKSMSLANFLTDSKAQATARVYSFAVGYMSNTTGFSPRFVNVTFSLGRSYDNSTLYSLTGNIIWKPSEYGVGRSVSTLISSLVSPKRDTTLVSLALTVSSNQNLLGVRSTVSSVVHNLGPGAGVRSALVTGEDAISYDFGNSTQDDLGLILPVTIVLLIVATGLFFRSILTPFITLGSIGIALGISQVFIVLVGTYIAKVDFTIPTILLTVLIGVGTDYSVFVIARYREERVRGATVQEAVETSVTWAGESIATSGLTVIISFLALTLTTVVYLRTMGFVVGLGVLVALSVALTLVPAIVSIVGGRTFWPYSGERFARYSGSVLSKLRLGPGPFRLRDHHSDLRLHFGRPR